MALKGFINQRAHYWESPPCSINHDHRPHRLHIIDHFSSSSTPIYHHGPSDDIIYEEHRMYEI